MSKFLGGAAAAALKASAIGAVPLLTAMSQYAPYINVGFGVNIKYIMYSLSVLYVLV